MKLFAFILISSLFITGDHLVVNNSTIDEKGYHRSLQGTHDLIKKAILEKKSMTFFYDNYLRKASPHVLGTKNGREQALFMQYDGESKSGLSSNLRNNWRCFNLEKIEDIRINYDRFYTAENHSQGQSCVDIEDIVVDY